MEVLTLWVTGRGEALPVFSSEEEARMFLGYGALESSWRVRGTSTGELISVLFGPCGSVERVALDPLPEVDIGLLLALVCMERKDFIKFLSGEEKSSGIPTTRKKQPRAVLGPAHFNG